MKKDNISQIASYVLFALALIFISMDFYYIYQGEMITAYYNGGEGLLYKDLRIDENMTEYYVNIQLYDYHDKSVGEYIAWKRTDDELMKLLAPVLFGSIAVLFLYYMYHLLKSFKLLGV
jgi:hypothetical protein